MTVRSLLKPVQSPATSMVLHGAEALGMQLERRLDQLSRRLSRVKPAYPEPARTSTTLSDVARQLNWASGLLAFSALADSLIEHYRGSFHNKTMYTPIVIGVAALATSLHGIGTRRHSRQIARDVAYGASFATGVVGTGFHFYNVGKRLGGFSWHNLFYAAPLGAPSALSLAGLLGFFAERIRGLAAGRRQRFLGVEPGRMLAGLAAGGLAGTAAEAALLHFRGAYQNPVMFVPVTAPPIAAALLARESLAPSTRPWLLTQRCLKLLIWLGLIGTGFHAYGVQRSMGGWRNWTQNLLNGPPLPAPPAFTALALAGLAALRLMKERNDG